MPYRIYGQHLEYLWRAPSIGSWENAYLNGECNKTQSIFWEPKPSEELYDTENDPWEVNNLAENPDYKDVLDRMRTANKNWLTRIYDAGFIPEADQINRTNGIAMYDYMRSDAVNFPEIMEAAETATLGKAENIDKLKNYLQSDESAIRYWGASGLLILKDKAAPATEELKKAINDPSPNVVIVAAEALYKLGEKEEGKKALLGVLNNPNEFARCHALNAIDCIEDNSKEIIDGTIEMIKQLPEMNRNRYDLRAARGLLEKWEIDPLKYNLVFNW